MGQEPAGSGQSAARSVWLRLWKGGRRAGAKPQTSAVGNIQQDKIRHFCLVENSWCKAEPNTTQELVKAKGAQDKVAD